MDSGQNPTSPMPGVGSNSGVPPVPSTPSASPFNNLNSRRNRSSRPNSANAIMPQAQPMTPMAPAGGMAASAPALRQKSPVNKGLIIGLVIFAIAIIGGIVALTMLPKGDSGSNGGTVSPVNSSAFNRFANLIMTGEDSSSPLATNSAIGAYLVNLSFSDEATGEYLKNANNLMSSATEELSKNQALTQYERFNDYITELEGSFSAVYKIYEKGEISFKTVLEKFIAEGNDAADKYVKDFYADFSNSDNPWLNEYANYMLAHATQRLEVFNAYKNAGCIVNNQVNADCANKVVTAPSPDTDAETVTNPKIEAANVRDNAVHVVVDSVLYLNSALKDPSILVFVPNEAEPANE